MSLFSVAFCCLAVYFGYLVVVPAVVAPHSGLYNEQITPRGSLSPLFCVWLWCTPAAILVWGIVSDVSWVNATFLSIVKCPNAVRAVWTRSKHVQTAHRIGYVGNIINHLCHLPAPFPRGPWKDLEGEQYIPTTYAYRYTSIELGLLSHLYRTCLSWLSNCPGSSLVLQPSSGSWVALHRTSVARTSFLAVNVLWIGVARLLGA